MGRALKLTRLELNKLERWVDKYRKNPAKGAMLAFLT